MPEEEYAWLPRRDILQFEEIVRLARAFTMLGVRRVRITGGEPLLRRELPILVAQLAAVDEIADLALTTNGVLLKDLAPALREAGLHRITVSLDTLRADRFRALTRFDELPRVLAGMTAARAHFAHVKIDSVIVRGTNEDEIAALLDYGRGIEMLRVIEGAYGPVTPIVDGSWAPADRFTLADGTIFGIISSTTEPFCRTCDRSRLTADGLWFRCLYARDGSDLRELLRSGASDEALREVIAATWSLREDRGAELRAAERERTPFIPVSRLRRDPHLEMHTRGG